LVNVRNHDRRAVPYHPSREADGTLSLPRLTGKTFLVTGASSGIGRAAALRLAAAGATVLAHGRSPQRMAEVAGAIGSEPLPADFARLAEVRRLADRVRERTGRLDAVLHNAGAFHRTRTLTEDGHESTFQTNYLASFLLQTLLNDLVLATPGSRVVVTTSVAARVGRVDLADLEHASSSYRPFRAYATTKLLSILFVRELRRRLAGRGVTVTSVHPGPVGTNFGAGSLFPRFMYRIPIRKELLIGYFVCTAEEGAEPLLWLATTPEQERADSLYFNRFTAGRPPSPLGDDLQMARALWARTEEMVQEWIGPVDPPAGAA